MIPQAYINEWRLYAPWQEDFQIEQDLIICRALNSIFSDDVLKNKLAFRGGTALHKLFINPPARYSEDIDLVQIDKEPFGEMINRLRNCLSFLGQPRLRQKEHNNTIIFQVDSNLGPKIKTKVEVNTREQFSVLGYKKIPFEVNSSWHASKSLITTFELEEILATKLRALYQRKKGRDLFDLWYALDKTNCAADLIVSTWAKYLAAEGNRISRKEFEINLSEKMASSLFLSDMKPLLKTGINYDARMALNLISECLVSKM
jgi:predicted nucleotidyltransferase component of viral defense system